MTKLEFSAATQKFSKFLLNNCKVEKPFFFSSHQNQTGCKQRGCGCVPCSVHQGGVLASPAGSCSPCCPLPCSLGVKHNSFFTLFPSDLTKSEQGKAPPACGFAVRSHPQYPSGCQLPTSPQLPPPPSLTKGKKEPELQLEIYHAIVYHEFLVNHIGEAGLFISETLNQYKVGLLVLKLGWSGKK